MNAASINTIIVSVVLPPAGNVLSYAINITKQFYNLKFKTMEPTDKNMATQHRGQQTNAQDKKDNPRVKTVTPNNDSGTAVAPGEKDSSNKGKGPKGENL